MIFGFAAGIPAGEDFTDFVVIVVLREELEVPHMPGIVSKNAVEGGVAVLEPAHVYRNDGDAGREQAFVFYDKAVRAGDAADENVDGLGDFLDIVNDFKRDVLVVLETLDEQFRLVFVT